MASDREIKLAVKRGELKARIEAQRQSLAVHSQPLASLLGKADQALAGVEWIKQRPGVVATALAAVAIARPRRAFRLGRRVFVLWKTWRALKKRLPAGLF